MFRSTFLILFLFSTSLIHAQFSCDNIKVLGTYYNAFETNKLTIMLTNTSQVDDGNENVYTGFTIVTDQGDTLTTAEVCNCFSLPNQSGDTIMYNVEMYDGLTSSAHVPAAYCGTMHLESPSCEISYCMDSIVRPELPYHSGSDCDYLKIVGLYEAANNGSKDYYLMLTFSDPNVRGSSFGYTSYQFFDHNNIAISEESGPHYYIPTFVGDTSIVRVSFLEAIESDFCATIKMENPTCELQYCHSISTSVAEVSHDFKVVPNLTSDFVHVKSNHSINKIEVFNSNGSLIVESNTSEFSISQFSAGMYIVVAIFKDGSKAVEKIIKL